MQPCLFFKQSKSSYILQKKHQLIYGVIFVCIFSIYGFFQFKNIFLLIFFFANIFHVTRQSTGILKLYNQSKNLIEMEYILYLFGILYFFIGLMRFYTPILEVFVSSEFVYNFFNYFNNDNFKIKQNKIMDLLTFFSGLVIFYPICFVDKPVHAILMGVTIHYSQYLYLTYLIDKGRNESFIQNLVNFKFFFYIFVYATIMTVFTLISKNNSVILTSLLIIPITGQMIHFYIDSFIWRFSDSHNREVSLKYLKV